MQFHSSLVQRLALEKEIEVFEYLTLVVVHLTMYTSFLARTGIFVYLLGRMLK